MHYPRFFSNGNLEAVLGTKKVQMVSEIETLARDKVVPNDSESLARYFSEKFRMILPVFDKSSKRSDPPVETQGGTRMKLKMYFRYEGNELFFSLRFPMEPPFEKELIAENGELVVVCDIPHGEIGALKDSYMSRLGEIETVLDSGRTIVDRFNSELLPLAQAAVARRKDYFRRSDEFLQGLAADGIRLVKLDDAPSKVLTSAKRVDLKFPVPQPTAEGTRSKPSLAMESYGQILSVITSMAHVFERSPKTFSTMGEEDLRTVLLVGLNANFKGHATGETFNRNGKTDILIRENDENIFIAECLKWGGPEHFRKKLDEQLFKYATWRDDKLAACIFSQNKAFSDVIASMNDVLVKHPQKVRQLPFDHQSGSRFEFRRLDDPDRSVILTSLAFDMTA